MKMISGLHLRACWPFALLSQEALPRKLANRRRSISPLLVTQDQHHGVRTSLGDQPILDRRDISRTNELPYQLLRARQERHPHSRFSVRAPRRGADVRDRTAKGVVWLRRIDRRG